MEVRLFVFVVVVLKSSADGANTPTSEGVCSQVDRPRSSLKQVAWNKIFNGVL